MNDEPDSESEGANMSAMEAVDPLLGTDISDLPKPEGIAARWWCAKPPVGNCHPGASLPFGMVSVCPFSGAYPSGYGRNAVSLDAAPERIFEDYTCTGFAHFQQSGTGRIRMYYNYLPVMPSVAGLMAAGERDVLEEETARPGFYSCRLRNSGILAELGVGERSVAHRYTFPASAGEPVVALDLTAGGLGIEGMETFPSAAFVEVTGESSARGWFRMQGVTIHFAVQCTARYDGQQVPVSTKAHVWRDNETFDELAELELPRKLTRTSVTPFGVVFSPAGQDDEHEREDRGSLVMGLDISFSLRSGDRARRVIDSGHPRELESVREHASEVWQDVLGRIDIEGASAEQRQIFYTALYHTFLKPADFQNENPFTRRDGPFYFDISTLWDIYKCHLPLVMTLFPDRGRDLVNFFLDTAAREGNFPISYLMDNVSERFDRQGSSLAHMTLTDAYLRGIEGVDWDRALRAMHRTVKLGRGKEFSEKGLAHPLSHTLDLAAANWCVATVARGLGDQKIYDKCVPLAKNWRNAYDPATGLLGDSEYYEGDRWNYSFRLLPDMAGRIEVAGGDQGFVKLLDHFFGFSDPDDGRKVYRFEGLNNEPDMETPYAYLYAGRHDRAAEVLRAVIRYQFTTGRGGLPGNDDSGGLSSWYVWSTLGLFPVSGQDVMLIGSPVFPRSVIKQPGGDFIIESENGSPENIYIESATLNGKSIDRAFLRLKEMLGGGHLKVRMTDRPGRWASEQRPPSFTE